MEKLQEECGVFGVFGEVKANVAQMVYYGLHALQHRGQEGCGIVVNDDGVFNCHKDLGLVTNVFTKEVLENLGEGNGALGHVRYGSEGTNTRENCQPMVVNHIKGNLAIVQNGTLINSYELRSELELEGSIFHTTSNTEIISYVITKERINAPSIEVAVERALPKLIGSFSLIIMSPQKLIAARDPHGFRPLCYGITEEGQYVVASESCALDVVGAKFVRDIKPGEIVVFTKNGIRSIDTNCRGEKAPCIFEYIYFARPDSVVDGYSVHEARKRAGSFLAEEHPVEADVVIGVPDSGLDGALGYSQKSGIPYGIGFLKNKYIGRTFIAPEQGMRRKAVKMKLNAIKSTVEGKRVILVDDSIVRGTTSGIIVKLLRDAGAKEVHMRITSPKFVDVCYYGTDISSRDVLIANHHTTEEIAEIIGVDSLGFLSLENVQKIPSGKKGRYCLGCFTGKYPTVAPNPNNTYKFDKKINK